jgi:hypothetical protein
VTAPSSLAGDDVVEAMLVMARCHYRVLLVMALPSQRWSWHVVAAESCCDGMLSPLSHAENGIAEATLGVVLPMTMLAMALSRWPWSWCCRGPC